MPTPNRGAADSLVNNFGWVHPYTNDQFHADVLVGRVDHQFSDNHSIYGRLSSYLPKYVLAGDYPAFAWTRLRQSYSFAIADTYLFSPRVVNVLTFGGNRDRVSDNEEVDGVAPTSGAKVVADLGLRGVNSQNLSTPGGFPVTAITGFSTLNLRPGGIVSNNRNFSISDSVSWSVGRHVLKFGGELRTYRNFNGSIPEGNYGSFNFNGSITGNAYADFLLGIPFSSSRIDPIVNRVLRSKEIGFFVTDTFKVTPKLTLDAGLRWDYFGSATYADGLQFNWDEQSGAVIVPESARASVSRLYPVQTIRVENGDVVPRPEKGNFAPRLAAAYRLTPTTVLRGGYGIFNEAFDRFARAQGGGPFQLTETFINRIENNAPLFQFPEPYPAGSGNVPSQSVSGYPLDSRNGIIHQFNFTVEKQIADVGVHASYIGSRNRGLNYTLSTNKPQPSLTPFTQQRRPYPQFVGTSITMMDGKTNYDSLLIQAKRTVGWVTFDAHWTWLNSMSDMLNLANPYDHYYWNRDFLARHRVVFNTLWELPIGRGKPVASNIPGALDHVIGGWKVAWVSFLQSGQYFSPSFSGSDPSNTNTSGGLPDRIADGNFSPGERRLERWFDTGAFRVPPAGRFGNSGVNVLEGPGLHTHNVTFAKRFAITERLNFHYQALIANIFNHPNFSNPASNISVPAQAGVLTSQHGIFSNEKDGPRVIEMRVRLEF